MKKFIAILGTTFVAFEAADAFLTLWAAHSLEGFQEVNPILAPIAGTWLSPVVKIVPAVLIAWGLARLGRKHPKTQPVTAVGLVGVVAFLGVVLASNLAEI